jgi:hypothetical protein
MSFVTVGAGRVGNVGDGHQQHGRIPSITAHEKILQVCERLRIIQEVRIVG